MTAKIPKAITVKMSTHPAFFQKVWVACAKIPKGQTKTYSEIASLIGHPHAARAVGMALKANPFAPTIPCHRVIRSDGKLGGYSAPGGIKTKAKMLFAESHGKLKIKP